MPALDPIPIRNRMTDISFPRGWYCVAESAEVAQGVLRPASWLDQQLIIYRTASTSAQVADAYCPHLGAHLASHDGRICDGKIICPFHKWRFDGATGRVVHIPYSEVLPPSSVHLTLHPTREVDGMILMWYDPRGAAPDHEPAQSLGTDASKWVLYETMSWETTCPFRDILENIFDTAHVTQLHNTPSTLAMSEFTPAPHGAVLKYDCPPENGEGGYVLRKMECHFSALSLMTQVFEAARFDMRFLYSFTPIDRERFVMKTRLYIKDLGSRALHEEVCGPFVERFAFEVAQDLEVLDYKKHLSRPRLCEGDGPIMQFREYSSQYYA